MTRAALAAALAAALLAAAPGVAIAKRPTGRCANRKATILAQNRHLVVYDNGIDNSAGDELIVNGELVVCRRRTGHKTVLTTNLGEFYWIGPPADDIVLHGDRLGWATRTTENGPALAQSTQIRVTNFATQHVADSIAGETVTEVGDGKIGSLEFDAAGSVAWIQCPDPALDHGPTNADSRPNCVHAGDQDEVRVARRGAPPQTLVSGRNIDPRSITLRDNKVTWRNVATIP